MKKIVRSFAWAALAGLSIFAMLATFSIVDIASTQGVGGVIEAARVYFLNTSGNRGWRVGVNSGNDLEINNVDTAPGSKALSGITIDQATGGIRFPGYSAAMLTTLAAPSSGYIVWNLTTDGTHTHGRLTISSAAGGGSWTNFD